MSLENKFSSLINISLIKVKKKVKKKEVCKSYNINNRVLHLTMIKF